jgi:hypothetical protein
MPTYLEILPEDIIAIIYRHLYSSIMCDMKHKPIYKNTKHFHKLLEITSDPFVCDLDYLGMLSINNIYDIFKYKKNKIEYNELYYRSHFTKHLQITLDNIEISNEVLYNLYKSNKRYYKLFVKEYFDFDVIMSGARIINKASFTYQQQEPFACLAELLYNVIDFYSIIHNIINTSLYLLECIEEDGQILTQRQRKDKYILNDMLGYHINNRYIIRFDYDIDKKSAFPILLSY